MVPIIHQVSYKLLRGVYLDGYICSTLHRLHGKSKYIFSREWLNFGSHTPFLRKLSQGHRHLITRAIVGDIISTITYHLPRVERGQQGVGIYCPSV